MPAFWPSSRKVRNGVPNAAGFCMSSMCFPCWRKPCRTALLKRMVTKSACLSPTLQATRRTAPATGPPHALCLRRRWPCGATAAATRYQTVPRPPCCGELGPVGRCDWAACSSRGLEPGLPACLPACLRDGCIAGGWGVRWPLAHPAAVRWLWYSARWLAGWHRCLLWPAVVVSGRCPDPATDSLPPAHSPARSVMAEHGYQAAHWLHQ